MRESLPIENLMRERLESQKKHKAEDLFGQYANARKKIYENVLEEIKKHEGNLTDHGPRHVDNILENIYKLIGKDPYLDGVNLYLLCVSALFHDAGNYFGRKNHNQKIDQVYGIVRGEKHPHLYIQEQKLVSRIAGAHTGKTKAGSKDAISNLCDTDQFNGERIYTSELAAILRLADELAEGPQRTSYFVDVMQDYGDSNIYHKYAQMVDVFIDRDRGLISLNVNVCIKEKDIEETRGNRNKELVVQQNVPFSEMMEMVYGRIVKLNQERCYCRHYSPKVLSVFKEVKAEITFVKESEFYSTPLCLEIQPIVYNDLVVPGENDQSVIEKYPIYEVSNLKEMILQEACHE